MAFICPHYNHVLPSVVYIQLGYEVQTKPEPEDLTENSSKTWAHSHGVNVKTLKSFAQLVLYRKYLNLNS